ncbi:MAG: biopolymer transporter ExbD [Myxococcales bacterium]|nr:biopolymer transporter ExbD [Myxococcales bacterium]
MARRRLRRVEEVQIDISPLIDMVFILLIFFMVSTTFVKEMKVELERPSAVSAVRSSTKALRVHIARGGAIYVEGAATPLLSVEGRVRQLLRESAVRPILVMADRLVQAEKLLDVVDKCRIAGAKDIGIATHRVEK